MSSRELEGARGSSRELEGALGSLKEPEGITGARALDFLNLDVLYVGFQRSEYIFRSEARLDVFDVGFQRAE